MTSHDLVIFDYDGVAADSELLNNRILAELLTEVGLHTTVEDSLDLYLGRRWLDCAPLIEAKLGSACPDDLQAEWTRRCHDRAPVELQPVPGFVDFVRSRPEARCIASSSPPAWIEMGLRRFGVLDVFAGSIFSAAVHVKLGKPHPYIFLHAARVMGADPTRTVVIEDTPTGVAAAFAAGMTVIGLCAGGHIRPGHDDRLRAAGAHRLASDYREVQSFLGDGFGRASRAQL